MTWNVVEPDALNDRILEYARPPGRRPAVWPRQFVWLTPLWCVLLIGASAVFGGEDAIYWFAAVAVVMFCGIACILHREWLLAIYSFIILGVLLVVGVILPTN